MMYVAKHYVRHNGVTYTAGEILPADLPEDKAAWLLQAGAAEAILGEEEAPCGAGLDCGEPEDGEEDAAGTDGDGYESDSAENGAPPAGETPEEDIDQDAVPPEIDAADGIVGAGPEPQPKNRGRGKGGKGK